MITRLFGPPRLVVRTSLAMFTVVAIVLTAVLLLIAIQGSGYVRRTVTDKLENGQRMLVALEKRQSRELQAQVEVVAESPTLKAALDTSRSRLAARWACPPRTSTSCGLARCSTTSVKSASATTSCGSPMP